MTDCNEAPLASIKLSHAKMELWPGHVRTVFPDGREVCAAPNGDETIIDTAVHELLHSVYAQVVRDTPSACLDAVSRGGPVGWTLARREEEAFAYGATAPMAQAIRKLIKAYGEGSDEA